MMVTFLNRYSLVQQITGENLLLRIPSVLAVVQQEYHNPQRQRQHLGVEARQPHPGFGQQLKECR